MPTKKKEDSPEGTGNIAKEIEHTAAYEAALQEYASALELLHKGDYSAAKERFLAIHEAHREEPELAERARTYARICTQRTAGKLPPPETADDCYYRAVMLSNDGRLDEAIVLFDRALTEDPTSVRVLYARSCTWALKGDAEKAVLDLRSAIAADPTVRFQASNDPDFEKIREEPAFIDVIEPTPAGA
jgi:tetratricopeptide (TPR) repeat protein